MNHLHPLFVAVLTPFSPATVLVESFGDDESNDSSQFGDDREDYGYEMQRQRRIDSDSNHEQMEKSAC
jgi:hypothetical protein